MSLKEVILEIADEMENMEKEGYKTIPIDDVMDFVKQIRRAVKAAGSDTSTSIVQPMGTEAFLAMGSQMDSKAKAIVERQRERQSEDAVITGDSMAMCVGGPSDGDYAPINPAMPKGAFCRIDGNVYELGEDGKLHHVFPG